MDCIKYKDFKNICRICLLICDTKFSHHVIYDIYNKLSDGIPFEANELPQQICRKCSNKINEIHSFSFQCKEANSTLMKCLNEFKNVQIKEEPDNDELMEIKEEITVEEHKIEFVGVDELNVINDELQIKQEITDEINHRNSVQDVETDDMSQDNTNDVKRVLICNICNKTFKYSSLLIQHKRIHSGERPYNCEICSKSFISLGNLKKHKQIHSGERPHACDMCTKAFIHLFQLNRHKLIHSHERPHECEICNKTFLRSTDLTIHKRKHSGERPYICEFCHKSFSQLCSLNEHKRIHSGERPYACDICKKTFIQLNHLNKHKRLHSNERLESSSGLDNTQR